MKNVIMFCDGGANPNPGFGGWAAYLIYKGHRRTVSGFEEHTTNNRMEITAALKGLSELKYPCSVDIYSDSKYLINTMTKWIENWYQFGWMNYLGEDVKNKDLLEPLYQLTKQHHVSWHWVKAHAGNKHNEYVDTIATTRRLEGEAFYNGILR